MTTITWPVYYYRKVNSGLIMAINFLIIAIAALPFIPNFLLSEQTIQENKDIVHIYAGVVAVIGVGIMLKVFATKHKATLTYTSNSLQFQNKEINLINANIALGKYGMPTAGSYGSVLFINNGSQEFKIGILNYTVADANRYTKEWSMKADCFIDKKDIESLLTTLQEKKQNIESSPINAFNKNELVFELRGSMKWGKTILLFYAFLAIPVIIMFLFNFQNPIITTILVLIAFGAFIYFIIKQSKTGTGYYVTIQNGILSFLSLKTKKEIFTTSINAVTAKVYIIELRHQYIGRSYYLTMKLKIPNFKTLTIGQTTPGIWEENKWKDLNLKTNWWTVSPPNYIVDEDSWNRLANILGVHI